MSTETQMLKADIAEYFRITTRQAAEIEALKADIATYVRAASEQATEIEHLKDVLSFVERWANHHGAKPSVSAVEALSVIQHHPAIKEITKSYSDGVVPATRDPYAEIEALRKDAERYRFIRGNNQYVIKVSSETIHCGGHVPVKPEKFGPALDQAIDAAMQTKEAS